MLTRGWYEWYNTGKASQGTTDYHWLAWHISSVTKELGVAATMLFPQVHRASSTKWLLIFFFFFFFLNGG